MTTLVRNPLCKCGRRKKPMSGLCWNCFAEKKRVEHLDRHCKIDGCERAYLADGFCQRHYTAQRAHGDPLANLRPNYVSGPLEERFWAKVEKTETCWLWTGAKGDHGYGVFNTGPKLVGAHRVSYELAFGFEPVGLEVVQSCGVRLCVNPEHLDAVSPAANEHRVARPLCKRGHDLSDAFIRRDTGKRMCRQCIRIRAHRQPDLRVRIPKTMRRRIFERCGYRCAYCGSPEARSIDHIVPKADRRRAGIDDLDETYLVVCCLSENVLKGTRHLAPASWGDRLDTLNDLTFGSPWRTWNGDPKAEAFTAVYA